MKSLLLASFAMLGACTCGRGPGLAQRMGEAVLIVGTTSTRDGRFGGLVAAAGQQVTQNITVRNVGLAPVALVRLSLREGSDAYASDFVGDVSLNPQDEFELRVTFAPPSTGDPTVPSVAHRALFALETLGEAEGAEPLTIEFEGIAQAGDCLLPGRLDFGEAPLGSAVRLPVAFTNASTTQEAEVQAPQGDDAALFSVETPSPFAITTGVSSPLVLRFTPNDERVAAASIRIRRSPQCPFGVVALSGRGSQQALSVEPRRIDFGRIPLNETAARQVVIRSRLGAPLPISSVTTTGAPFLVVAPPPAEIPPRGAVAFLAGCRPALVGPTVGTVELTLGTVPPRVVDIPVSCEGGGPRMRLTPSGVLNMGLIVTTGNQLPSKKISVQNIGNAPPSESLRLGRGEGQLPYFALVPLNGSIDDWRVDVPSSYPRAGLPGVVGQNSTELTVTFVRPASGVLMPGLRQADIFIYSNDAVESVQRVRLVADVRDSRGCTLDVTPSVNFGEVPPGFTGVLSAQVTNVGSMPCSLVSAELTAASGVPFSLRTAARPPFLIAPGTSVPVDVLANVPNTARPGDSGSATLLLTTTDATRPTLPVNVSLLVSTCVAVLPETLDFGIARTGCRSAPRTVFLYNTCNAAVSLRSLPGTPGPFQFTAAPSVPRSLVAGGLPLSFAVRFAPTVDGRFSESLPLAFDVAGVARTIAVTMKGEAGSDGLTTDTFVQLALRKADVLFTIDNSCSMADEQMALANNLTSFLDFARQRNVDFSIGVTTTDDSIERGRLVGAPKILRHDDPQLLTNFGNLVMVGTRGSGLEQPLATSTKAVTPPLVERENAGLVRPDATLSVIIITDANDQSTEPLSYYQSRLLGAKGAGKEWLVSVSVVGPFSVRPGCMLDSSQVDTMRYVPLIRSTAGVQADICTTNWARDLEDVARSSFGAKTKFPLTSAADTSQPVTVTVDGQPATGASYDGLTGAIVFTGQPPPAGSTVRVAYRPVCL